MQTVHFLKLTKNIIKDKDFLWKIQTMFEKKEKRKMNNQDQ